VLHLLQPRVLRGSCRVNASCAILLQTKPPLRGVGCSAAKRFCCWRGECCKSDPSSLTSDETSFHDPVFSCPFALDNEIMEPAVSPKNLVDGEGSWACPPFFPSRPELPGPQRRPLTRPQAFACALSPPSSLPTLRNGSRPATLSRVGAGHSS